MKNNKVSLLDPGEDKIREYVEQQEEEWGFGDKLLYIGCVREMERVNLCEISEKDVNGPIKVFLINWGMMMRVIGGLKNNWKKELTNALRDICNKLENFRKMDLKSSDISKIENDIKECYENVRMIVKCTSASKILHLICPNFFLMWDFEIRRTVSEECKNRGDGRIGDHAPDYYKFIFEIQKFLIKYDNILAELSKKYSKSKLRILDEFMWKGSR